jgi:hypothetical protein
MLTVTLSQPAGTKRGQGKGSFVGFVASLVDRFYEEVLQSLKAWNPAPPRVRPTETEVPRGLVVDGEHAEVANALTAAAASSVVAEIVSDQGPKDVGLTAAGAGEEEEIEPFVNRSQNSGLPVPYAEGSRW